MALFGNDVFFPIIVGSDEGIAFFQDPLSLPHTPVGRLAEPEHAIPTWPVTLKLHFNAFRVNPLKCHFNVAGHVEMTISIAFNRIEMTISTGPVTLK